MVSLIKKKKLNSIANQVINLEIEALKSLKKSLNKNFDTKYLSEQYTTTNKQLIRLFKDAEKGDKEINIERTEEALETKTSVIAAGCPFCNTMISDGVKAKEKENDVKVLDIVELIVNAQDL